MNVQHVLSHVSDRSSHLTGKRRNFFIIRSVVEPPRASDDVMHDVVVWFTFAQAKGEVIWFDTLVSD